MSAAVATGIPEELKIRRRWVNWRLEERAGEPTKVPYSPLKDRKKARSTDPATWADYPDAIEAYRKRGHDGVGFVFSPEDRITGIDLDGCRDPETGELEPWAEEIVRELDSYSEISPSGTGVHVIVHGKLPPGGNRKGRVEMYDRGRFFTMTGRRLTGTPPTVNERQRELVRLHRSLFAAPKMDEPPNGHHPGGFTGDDRELLERAAQAANGEKFRRLWEGDTEGYDSASEADLALVSHLAFWTGGDRERIDRLFRESGLYREKWERPDYRERTIRAALARADFYRPEGSTARSRLAVVEEVVEEPTSGGDPPGPNGRGAGESYSRFNRTDLGNAERFVAQHGEDVRYCYPWGKWLVWTGPRWERDDAGKVHRLAKETVRSIYREAAAAEDEDERKALAQHATRSEAEARIRAMLELAKSEVPVSPDELDADSSLLNASNGTIDFRTGDLRDHRREDLITKIAPVEYDPNAEGPEWERFLERVLPSDGLRAFVRRAAGYSATGDTSEQCLFINHGSGNNGKSTFQEALAAALGDYAMRAPTEMLMAKRSGGVPNDVARLKGARFVTASETEEGRRLAESLVKDLTGQDTISARFMRAEWFDFRPTHKLWLSTNHKPEIRGTDNAIWRRIRLIPWAVTVPPAERDKKLPEKLRGELSGILAWVVRGCIEWHREGLRAPDEVRRATGEYRTEMDVLAGFIADCCVVDPAAWVKFKDLYAAYERWCSESGESPESKRRLGNHLKERGYEPDRGTANVPIRRGIGLRDDHQPDPAEGSKVTQGNSSYPTVTPKTPSKSQESEEDSYSSYPESHINGSEVPSREITEKQGNSGNSGNSEAAENDKGERGSSPTPGLVEELLQTPPAWLTEQLARCRRDPALIRPACSAIAYEIYGTSARWEGVKPAVDRWLEDAGEDLGGLRELIEEDEGDTR